MRATTEIDLINDWARKATDQQLNQVRIKARNLAYLIEGEIYRRTGDIPIIDTPGPTLGDRLFMVACVLVMGLMTWLSWGAWAI